jgi:hypothetical protein
MAMPVDSGEFFVFIVIPEQAGHKTKVSLARLQGALLAQKRFYGMVKMGSRLSIAKPLVALQYKVVVASGWVAGTANAVTKPG